MSATSTMAWTHKRRERKAATIGEAVERYRVVTACREGPTPELDALLAQWAAEVSR